MTFQEFLDELAKTPRRWKLSPSGAIRCIDGCPLMTVFGTSIYDCREARKAGLSHRNIALIIDGTDNIGAPKTRAKILEACGI